MNTEAKKVLTEADSLAELHWLPRPVVNQQVPEVAVPDGWKLVPIEITDAMVDASGCEGQYRLSAHEQAQRLWSAMLAASPSHSQQSAEYRCHKCGTETPPPEPFKAYVKCACGTLTAATAALSDDRCPSHESEQGGE